LAKASTLEPCATAKGGDMSTLFRFAAESNAS
jgi:hypothetical protein